MKPGAFEWTTAGQAGTTGAAALVPAPDPQPARASPPARVLVADSWLVDHGRALALGVHRGRFLGAILEHGVDGEAFWEASVQAVPASGSWFPRVDLVEPATGAAPVLRLQVRPAPARHDSARVATAATDPRTEPLVKGPDLLRLDALRSAAVRQGADEAIVVDSAGFVAEGAYSSVVWWRGDVLCLVADEVPRLAGVTERSLVTLATALGVEVARELVEPGDLEGLEVWILNSLHGARIVTSWTDGPSLAEEPGRLRLWRTRLAALARPAIG